LTDRDIDDTAEKRPVETEHQETDTEPFDPAPFGPERRNKFEVTPVERRRRDESPSEVERTVALERSRLELEKRAKIRFRAYLVGVELGDDDPSTIQENLQELGALVRSLGDECVGAIVQKRAKITPHTLIGTGKAEEIRRSCGELSVDYIVCDKDLSPSQVRNLEKIIGKPVLDRTGVILQIFSKNAKTREAKTQVEIANLEYMLPRLANAWIAFERQRGTSSGASNRVRGAGEAQIELDRRRVREKIAFLRRDLEKISKERVTQRKGRQDEFQVVLVGYTNAGKTTVMNGLTDSHLSANDNLFETLDSSVRILKGSVSPRILVTDTVGFIRNLPHSLVASFRSTLEETADADLLIHVVDASHPRYQDQIRITEEVLKTVGAGDVPRMYVFNKVDAVAGGPRVVRILARSFANHILISAEDKDDIRRLREAIIEYISRDLEERTVEIPYAAADLVRNLYLQTRVLSVTPQEEGAVFQIRARSEVLRRIFNEPAPARETTEDREGTLEDDPWSSGEFSFQQRDDEDNAK
jgi:GTP-binding protein HflX